MIFTVALIGMIAMLVASLPKRIFKYGLEVAWIIIGVFLAIRYDFGNDYMGYLENFDYINYGATFRIDRDMHSELGWQIICYLFKPFGFFAMVAALTAFECWVIYRFVKEYVPDRYYWLAIFLFVFDPSLMLIGSSAMRQMMAITIFVASIKYIKQKKPIHYLILIYIATQFHTSAVILYPFYLLGYVRKNQFGFWTSGILIFLYAVFLYFGKYLGTTAYLIADTLGSGEAVELYTENAVFQEGGTGIGIMVKLFIFSYVLLTLYKRTPLRIVSLIFLAGMSVVPFSSAVPMLGRLSYYFDILGIVFYPNVLKSDIIENIHQRTTLNWWGASGIILIVLFLTIYEYVTFFTHPIWVDKFSSYHTIFEVL